MKLGVDILEMKLKNYIQKIYNLKSAYECSCVKHVARARI